MIIPSVHITSDQQIFWQHGFVKLNETIVTTWAMMIAMTLGSMSDYPKACHRANHLTLAKRA